MCSLRHHLSVVNSSHLIASKAIVSRPTQSPKRSPKEEQTNHRSVNFHATSDAHDTEHGEDEETFEDAVHEQDFAPDAVLAHKSLALHERMGSYS